MADLSVCSVCHEVDEDAPCACDRKRALEYIKQPNPPVLHVRLSGLYGFSVHATIGEQTARKPWERVVEYRPHAWIPCAERMPDGDRQVLFVWHDTREPGEPGIVCLGRWLGEEDGYWVDLDLDCSDVDSDPRKCWPGDVTHWIELPTPPGVIDGC